MSQEIVIDKAWYQQFWPWFVIALPGTAVIASFITLYIAITNADEVINIPLQKYGKTWTSNNEYLSNAKSLGVEAKIEFDMLRNIINIELDMEQSQNSMAEHLNLQISHPTLAELDELVILSKVHGNSYQGRMQANHSGQRNLWLESDPQYWGIAGNIALDQQLVNQKLTIKPS